MSVDTILSSWTISCKQRQNSVRVLHLKLVLPVLILLKILSFHITQTFVIPFLSRWVLSHLAEEGYSETVTLSTDQSQNSCYSVLCKSIALVYLIPSCPRFLLLFHLALEQCPALPKTVNPSCQRCIPSCPRLLFHLAPRLLFHLARDYYSILPQIHSLLPKTYSILPEMHSILPKTIIPSCLRYIPSCPRLLFPLAQDYYSSLPEIHAILPETIPACQRLLFPLAQDYYCILPMTGDILVLSCLRLIPSWPKL